MEKLNVRILQETLKWEDAAFNLQQFDEAIELLDACDLIVLPEMFTTGFSMQSGHLAESMKGKSVTWMKEKAARLNSAICGSLIIADGGEQFNRFLFVQPDGTIQHYDKRHLFRMAGEAESFTAGKEQVIVDYKGWKICLQVCYDLRFPVWSRNAGNQAYDVLIYVANWPSPRANAWDTLLKARAIENQAYVVGCNRIGEDPNGNAYLGGSLLVDYLGHALHELPKQQTGAVGASLSKNDLDRFREKFPVGLDADAFEVKP